MNVYVNGHKVDPVDSWLYKPIIERVAPSPLESVGQGKETGDNRPHIRITRCSPRPIRDFTNLVGGHKPLEDRLVDAGFIPGDGEDQIRSTFDQKKVSKKDAGTIIEITYPD